MLPDGSCDVTACVVPWSLLYFSSFVGKYAAEQLLMKFVDAVCIAQCLHDYTIFTAAGHTEQEEAQHSRGHDATDRTSEANTSTAGADLIKPSIAAQCRKALTAAQFFWAQLGLQPVELAQEAGMHSHTCLDASSLSSLVITASDGRMAQIDELYDSGRIVIA